MYFLSVWKIQSYNQMSVTLRAILTGLKCSKCGVKCFATKYRDTKYRDTNPNFYSFDQIQKSKQKLRCFVHYVYTKMVYKAITLFKFAKRNQHVDNCINILRAAFVQIFFCQKITKPNCNQRKAMQSTYVQIRLS